MASAQAPQDADADAPGLAKTVNLSIPEQLQQGKMYVSQMESFRDGVRRELEEARQKRDVVKTLCLNDKLNQLDVALTNGTERMRALSLAADRNDKELTNHEFTILSVLHQRAQQLEAEAKQCIGKEIGFVGESSIKFEIDPMPDEDVTDLVDITIVTPPSCASCFQ